MRFQHGPKKFWKGNPTCETVTAEARIWLQHEVTHEVTEISKKGTTPSDKVRPLALLAQKEECHVMHDQTTFMHHLHGTWHIKGYICPWFGSSPCFPGGNTECQGERNPKKSATYQNSQIPTSIQGQRDNFLKFLLKTPNFYSLPFWSPFCPSFS